MHVPHHPPAARSTRWTVLRLSVFMGAVVACLVSQAPPLFVLGAALCGGFALIELGHRRWSPATLLVASCLAALLIPAFLKPYMGLAPVFYAFSTITVLLASWALAQYPPAILARVFRWVYVVCTAGICVGLAMHAGEPEALGKILPDTSVNGIPSYMLVLQVGVSLSFFACHGRLPMLSPWITGWVAFLGIGRGSLIVAALIIAVTLLFNLQGRQNRLSTQLIRALLVLLAIAAAVITGPEVYYWISSHTKLSAGLVDTHRAAILEAYWARMDAVSWLIGADFAGTIIDDLYHGNPHIAFLRTHSFFGLPLTLLALLSPLAVWAAPAKGRDKRWVYALFCGLLVLRGTTEPILFPTLLDLIYFTVLFLPFRRDTISSQPSALAAPPSAPGRQSPFLSPAQPTPTDPLR